MNKIWIVLLLLLSGCVTAEQAAQTSIEATFQSSRAKVKDALVATLTEQGYSIKREGESHIIFEKTTQNLAASIFYGSDLSPNPHVRISAIFLNDDPTTVKFKGFLIQNANTGYERSVDLSASKDFTKNINSYISNMKKILLSNK